MAAGSGLTRWSGLGVLIMLSLIGLGASTERGCQRNDGGGDVQKVIIAGETFRLEVAADEPTRTRGLGGRNFIAPDGGMLFVFPVPRRTYFVMRDCPVDIDIIFLGPQGHVLAMYEMRAEAPRGPDEGLPGTYNARYEERLTKYDSRYAAQFAIELAGGTLKRLKGKIREGDRIELPYASLKRRAR